MKQQVLIIHGGNTFKTYKDYLEKLKSKEITLDRIRPGGDWKGRLQENLGDKYDVLYPSFPNKQNAQYKEWKILFEKVLDITDKELILIGHSLGAMFLIKYLSENKIDKKIKKLILVASPYKRAKKGDEYIRFAHTGKLKNISKQCKNIVFIHSKDDEVVDFGDFKKYKSKLPEAKFIEFKDRNHFFTPNSLPEIIGLIKEI